MIENEEITPAASDPSEGTPADNTQQNAEIPSALRNVDPQKLAELRAKMAKFINPSGEKTISGSEAPEPPVTQGVTTGKDVDWSEYDLEYSVRHLYKDAQFRMTSQGPKWVALLDMFHSVERDFRNYGKKVNSSQRDGEQENLNLGEYLNDMLNSPDGWRLVSVMPAGLGKAGILLQRSVPYVLPDPTPLKKETEVEAPSDGELEQVEGAAIEFMAGEGLAPEAEAQSSLEQTALALNGPADRDPGLRIPKPMLPPMDEAAGVDAEAALQGEDFEKEVTDDGRVEG